MTIKSIVFDIDGTLSSEVSWLKLTEGLNASVGAHSKIFEEFLENKLGYQIAKSKLIELWQKTGNANREFMYRLFHSWKLKEDALEIISYLKKRYRLVLISGSVDLYVQTVAEKLDITDWYANTTLVWDKEGNLIDFRYFRDQANKKLEQFNEFKTKHGFSYKNSAVVGDGDTDLELFKKIKFSVMVEKEKPHPELEKLAFTKIHNLKELKKIL